MLYGIVAIFLKTIHNGVIIYDIYFDVNIETLTTAGMVTW